jgi:ADP-dependent NAD(P)H-hydrate dehydratase / NAD(P)H-hydrate epimerase
VGVRGIGRQYNESMSHPRGLYSVAQVRAFDAHAIQVQGVPGFTLMQRAGEAALRVLRSRWPAVRRITIVCGGGNNGGDGYVLGSCARAAGLEVNLLAAVDPAELRGDALRAADEFSSNGGLVRPFSEAGLAAGEVLADALLGTGVREPVRADLRAVIEAMNRSGLPVLALDLPSGLHGDRGFALGAAVRADTTVTFVAPKLGLFLGDGPEYAGRVWCDEIGVSPPAGPASDPLVECIEEADIARALPARQRTAHKGDFGRVLLIAGGPGMGGAARLAGEGALRSGAGLVTVATAAENVPAILAGRPELICHATPKAAALAAPLAAATVVAVGPGLGTGPWARSLLDAALECGKPMVLDADALNLLAAAGQAPPADSILTPHPGEAARLLGMSSAQVQADRLGALKQLVARTKAVVVLKGAGSLVGAPGQIPALCTRGNPGMAAPGMGDVLTGAIAGILAQCADPWLGHGARPRRR